MSKHRPPTLADSARRAAHGRNVVASAGTLDGPFMAALAKLQLSGVPDTGEPSTWGDGVVTDNPYSYIAGGAQGGT